MHNRHGILGTGDSLGGDCPSVSLLGLSKVAEIVNFAIFTDLLFTIAKVWKLSHAHHRDNDSSVKHNGYYPVTEKECCLMICDSMGRPREHYLSEIIQAWKGKILQLHSCVECKKP